MSAISVARAARFIFRPSAASAGGVCGRTDFSHQRPNAALAAAAYRRHMSEVVPTRPAFLVDTLALVRGMEARGIKSEHAEAITAAITVVMNDWLESVGKSFVSKGEMQKVMQKSEMIRDADFSKLKSKVQSSQEHHFSSLQRSIDKLQVDIDLLYWRIRDELTKQMAESNDRTTKQIAELTKQMAEFNDRTTKQMAEFNDRTTKQIAEITKQMAESNDRTAKQMAESNDRTAKQMAESNDRTTKLDHDIQAMRAQLEAAKFEVIKYCIGTLVLTSTITFAVLRSWL